MHLQYLCGTEGRQILRNRSFQICDIYFTDIYSIPKVTQKKTMAAGINALTCRMFPKLHAVLTWKYITGPSSLLGMNPGISY